MKFQIKTVNEESFQVEANETDTFKTVKGRITQAKGYPTDEQRLVYAGKVLIDNATIGDAKIDPEKFVVLILGKKQEDVNSTNVAVALVNSAEKNPADVQDRPTPAPPPPSPASDPGSPSIRGQQSTNNANPQQNASVASNNANSTLNQDSVARQQQQADASTIFRNHPMLQTLKAIIRGESPELLDEVLLQLIDSDPVLASTIINNRTKFFEVINEGGEPSAEAPAQRSVAEAVSSQENRTDTSRVKAMGFREDMIRRAYAASDKNESLAVEFLLSQTNAGGNQ